MDSVKLYKYSLFMNELTIRPTYTTLIPMPSSCVVIPSPSEIALHAIGVKPISKACLRNFENRLSGEAFEIILSLGSKKLQVYIIKPLVFLAFMAYIKPVRALSTASSPAEIITKRPLVIYQHEPIIKKYCFLGE